MIRRRAPRVASEARPVVRVLVRPFVRLLARPLVRVLVGPVRVLVRPLVPTRGLALGLALGFALALAVAGEAAACVCERGSLEERLDRADAAVVGRVVQEAEGELNGASVRLLTVEVDQRVKGDLERTIVVRSPSGTNCDLRVERDTAVGLLLTKGEGDEWLGSTCSVVEAGALVVVGGEPRGGAIKVVVGIVILALVLGLSVFRLRRGSRPELPGAPGP